MVGKVAWEERVALAQRGAAMEASWEGLAVPAAGMAALGRAEATEAPLVGPNAADGDAA